uniref:HYR domain-containing protein n=1 Tax=Aquimarina aggregata TaxID=1642818 RepID=UPI00248FCC6E
MLKLIIYPANFLFCASRISRNHCLYIIFFLLLGFSSFINAQDAELLADGPTSICIGETTTLQVIIGASVNPYSVVYSDGTSNFTINNYNSDGDPDSPTFGGDPIFVTPLVTTTYSLVSVTDPFNTPLPVNSSTVTITVNPFPSNINTTINSGNPICYNTPFLIDVSAMNASTYELWNETNTSKIGDIPINISILSNTNYTVRAISSAGCISTELINLVLENTPPTISGEGDKIINPNLNDCSQTLPDYRSTVTVSDNCSLTSNITLTQNPLPGLVINDHGTIQAVAITATDESGNENIYNFNVTLIDNQNPDISCVTNQTEVGDVSCEYTYSGTTWNATASDNCAINSLTYTLSGATTGTGINLDGITFSQGVTTVTWTATDIAGLISNCSFTVEVTDSTNPTINCVSNQTENTDNNQCFFTKTDNTWDVSTNDNCGIPSVSYVLTGATINTISSTLNGVSFNQGVTVVQTTATDASGNNDTCSFTVTINDSKAPTIIDLPLNVNINTTINSCTRTITWTEPTASDNCSIQNLTQTSSPTTGLINGSDFPVGTTIITYTAQDTNGNSISESFNITVVDNQNPQINCPSNITQNSTIGICGSVVTYTPPTGSDNCPGSTTLQIAGLPSGATFPVGTTTNTFEITDAAGNSTTCSFDITITDIENPTIVNLPTNIIQNNDFDSCGAIVNWTEPTAADNCSGSSSIQTSGNSNGSFFPIGDTVVTYTATDTSGNSINGSFTITINDTQAPIIQNCPSNISKPSNLGICSTMVSWTEPSATDNCSNSGNIVWTKSHSPGDTFPVGTTTVTYIATDEAGNNSLTCSFDILVEDLEAPVLSNCPIDITTNVDTGECFATVTWTEPNVNDNCTGSTDIIWVKSHNSGDTFPTGTTTVTYTATDESGNNSAICSFIITVDDNEAPNAVCATPTLSLDTSGNATLTDILVDGGSSDNCTTSNNLMFTFSQTTFNCSDLGANAVIVTVTDEAGNSSTCNTTVTIIDTTTPILNPSAQTTNGIVNTDIGLCAYTVQGSQFDPTVTDNCPGSILSYTVTGATTLTGTGSLAGENLLLGDNTITWTASDGTNTSSSLIFTKTVVDNQQPTVTAVSNQFKDNTLGVCGYVVSGNEFDPIFSDNCGITSITYTINSDTPVVASTLNGVTIPIGLNTIVWTASDGTNTRSTSFRVTVTDNESPEISSIADISEDITTGCDKVINWTEPSVTDNCSGVILTQIDGLSNGSAFPVGTTTIIYRATDASGNSATMNFDVTVNDLTPPVLTCVSGSTLGNPFIREADTGDCFYTVQGTEFDPTTDDGCQVDSATNSFDGTTTLANKKLPVGTTTITWTAIDENGNSSSCSIYVSVEDNQDPTFTAPTGNFDRNTDPTQCYFTVNDATFDLQNLSDNCDLQNPTYIITKNATTVFTGTTSLSGLQLPKDETDPYVIQWTLSDINGNAVIANTFTITVSDNQAPTFVCNGNVTRNIPGSSCNYTVQGTEFDPTSLSDNCDISTDLSVTYVLDGVSGGVSSSLENEILPAGQHTIIWTITDSIGNASSCEFNITIIDEQTPSISTVANQTENAAPGGCVYTVVGTAFDPATVTDNCPGVTLTNNQNGTNTLDGFSFPVGINIVVWTATDAGGNVTTMEYQVEVLDISPPDFELIANSNTVVTVSKSTNTNDCFYETVGAEFDPQAIIDNCTLDNFTITNDYNNYRSLDFATFPVGTTAVNWSITDNAGNTTTKTLEITVVDDVKPVINCPSSTLTRVKDRGESFYTVRNRELRPNVDDNCGISSYTYSISGATTGSGTNITGVQLNLGMNILTWTAVDNAVPSNTQTCIITVNVTSSLFPSLSCVDNQVKDTDTNQCSYTAQGTEFDPFASTAGATLVNDYNNLATLDGAVFPEGDTLVTWTASQVVDGVTYTDTCNFYVIVEDNELPSITPPADITVGTTSICSAQVPSLGTPNTSDNCGVLRVWNNAIDNSYSLGTQSVTWFVEDIHENISSTMQNITVVDDDPPTFNCRSSITRRADEGQNYYTVFGDEFKPFRISDCSTFTTTNDFNNTASLSGVQFPIGTTTVTWTFTDALGNTSTCIMTITINDNTDPSPPVTCRANQIRNTDIDICTYTIQGAEMDVSSTATGVTFTYTLTGATTGTGSSSLANIVLNRGETVVTWTADNGSNSNSYCTYSIFIIDNQDPSIMWPPDLNLNADLNDCVATGVNLGTPTSTDNCDGPANISYTQSTNETTFELGETLVYWRARDVRGNLQFHTQRVVVTDNQAPVITCPTVTYYREYTNPNVDFYYVNGNEFTPPVSDNCEVTSYTNNRTGTGFLNGEELSAGNYTFTWTASDGTNTTVCDVNVVVVDALEPEIECSGNATANSDTGSCTFTIPNGDSSYDTTFVSSAGVSRTLTHDLLGAPSNTTLAGADIPVGTTTITWTATQTIGGTTYTSTCNFNFTVEDEEAPVLDTPFEDVTLNITPGACNNTTTLTPPTATDNCSAPGDITITSNAPATFPIGLTIVRWALTDEAGNQTIYDQNVTIIDNEAPIITNCPSTEIIVNADGASCQAVVNWPALIVNDDCSGVASFISNFTSGSLFPVGTTSVIYTATDNNGNISNCTFDVTVTDTPPTITCVSDQLRNVDSGSCSYTVVGNELDPIDITDNCTTPVVTWSFINPETNTLVTGTNTLSGVTIPRGPENGINTGKVTINWSSEDSGGQTSTCSYILTINDNEPPIIVVQGNQIRPTDLNQNFYTVQGAEFDNVTASDNCGIVTKIVNEFNVTTLDGQQLALGDNTITWQATDDSGNIGTAVFTVTVIDTEEPRLLVAPSNISVNISSGCSAEVNYTAPTFTDNVTAQGDLSITVTPSVAVPGYEFPLGDTNITYTITDEAGNTFGYDFTVTVIDNIPPTIICPIGDSGNQFNRNTDNGEAFYTTVTTEFDPTNFSDNCDVEVSNDYNNKTSLAGETFPIGTTTVVWTAIDDSNNSSSCSIDLVVTDVELPIINNCPDTNISRTAETGECYYQIVGSEFDPFSFEDNAGLSRLTYSIDGAAEVGTNLGTTLSGEQIPVGTLANPTTTVLWRLYDTSDNVSATCTSEFTITDTQNPTFVTISTQTRSLDIGANTYTAKNPADISWNIPATDNCSLQTITYQIDSGSVVGSDLSTSIIGETFGVGSHTVVWEATDVNGNTNTGTYQVIITDTEDPTVVCNDITIQLDNTGNYSLTTANINAIALGSSDPSGIASTVVTPNTFTCSETGANTVTLTVTDNNGNIASCNATVTVQDTTPPVASCKPISLVLDAFGNVNITPQDIDNGSSDTCGSVSLSANKTTFDCTNLGINTVTLTVTDINGNSSTCDATVTILDDINPVAVCQNITVSLDVTGNTSITGLDVDNGSFDNCQGTLTRALSKSSFDCTDIGSNMITLTVTDSAGNSDTCTASVTVEDTIPPNAIAQDITINLDTTGNATITALDIDNGSSDSCGIATITIDKTSFDCSNLGSNPVTNTVTLTVTDVNNNVATATALVTVEDDIAPTITCTTSQIVGTDSDKCGYAHNGTNWDATASDGCVAINNLTYSLSGATVLADNPINTTLNGQLFNSGVTTVTWTAIDGSGTSSQCSFTVTVNDDTPPIAIAQNISIQLDAAGTASITANDINNGSTDNCAIQSLVISTTDFSCADFGSNIITLTVTDTNGNISTDNATVTVEDTTAPLASCTPITIQLDATGNYTLSNSNINTIAFGSSDNCPNFTASVSPDSFDCAMVGTNTVTLTITDIAGNIDSCTTTVTVEDNTPPIALCKNITIQLDEFGDASILAEDIDNGSSDSCGINVLTVDENTFGCSNLGPNTVVLTVRDNNGNESTCNAIVTVEDNISPVFTSCPSNQAVVTDNGACTYTHTDNSLNPLVTDNCDSTPSLTYSLTGATTIVTGVNTTLNGQIFEQGITTVTWNVTDSESNTNSCSYTINVTDTEDPIAICQAVTLQLQRDGTVSLIPTDINNGSTDNCAISTYEISKDNISFSSSLTYTCPEIGSNTAYLRVTDSSGRIDVCSTIITIQDTQAPTLDDVTDRNVVTDTNICTYTHMDDTWNPTDNCDTTPTITYTLSGATTVITGSNITLDGQVFEPGTTTVTWTVSDNATPSNTGTVTFDVVVTDNENPTISCPSNITQDVDNGGDSSVTVSGISAPVYSDNCAVTKLTYELSGATIAAPQVSGINELSSSNFNLGTTTVTYIVEDAAGNTETCDFLVTVNALPDNTVIVSETSIQTSEDLTTDSFTVVLPFEPSGTVVFNVVSDDLTEGTVSTSTLTFDSSNWDIPQTVTITGVNDDLDDDDIGYTIILTTDQAATDDLSGYENVNPSDVTAINLDNDIAGVTVSTISGNTTEDNGTATFTIVLDTEPTENVTVTLSSNDLSESDTFTPTSLTFTSTDWDIPQTITVTGKDDDIVDGDVTYTIVTSNTSSLDPKYTSLVVDDITIINEDNDNVGVTVTPTSLTTSEAGGTATFTVVLDSKPATDTQDFVVVVNVVSSNTNEGTVNTSSLTFTAADWDNPQTVTVTGVDDILVDGSISYSIINTIDTSLTTDNNYDGLNPDDVAVNNTDDDTATLSIDSVTETEGNSGTIDYIFTITHSGAEVVGGYGVTFFTSNVEARAPSDFTANGGRIDFITGAIGETQNITISVNGDTAVEINERFNVVLNSIIAPGKNITIDPSGKTGVGTIINDDSTTVSILDASISEGNTGTSTLTFTVELSGEVEDGLTIDYTTVDGTATTANSDYIANSGTLTFDGLANEQETIEITINGDEIIELDESFTINLSNIVPVSAPNSSITFSNNSATGTIINDDEATISITGFSVNENVGTANFTISTSQPIQNETTLEFTTADISALAGSDYTAVPTTLLTFGGINAESQTISVTINNDNIIEPTETFNGIINNLITNGQDIILNGGVGSLSSIGEIIDNDTATLSIDDISVNEGDGTATFTVSLTGNVQNNFTLDYSTANNTAIASSDYTAIPSTTLTFGGTNNNTQTFQVTILENTIAEPTETYFINLDNLVTNGQTGITILDNQGEGEIIDNDSLELSIAGFTITETETTQTANFTVTSNIAAEEDIVFTLTTAHITTTEATDFTTQTAQSYTLSAGDTSMNLPVAILGDLIAEPTETFTGTIAITNANAQQVTIATPTATSTINDNDSATLSIAGFTITETETTQTANFTVTSNIAAEEDIVFTLTTAHITTTEATDFTTQTAQSYTLSAGDTSMNLPVAILGDLIAEPTETFTGTIAITNANAQQVSIATPTATSTINDNDSATLSINDVSVNEGDGTATFTVSLTGNVQNNFTLDYSTANNTAIASSDYTAIPSTTLTFGGTNNNTQTFQVTILENTIAEPTETYFINLDNLVTNGQTGITILDNQGEGEIIDNDSLELSIAGFTITETEATQTANFTVTSNIAAEEDIVFTFTTAHITTTEAIDFTTQTAQSYTLSAGDTTMNLPIAILGDLIAEPTETFTGTIAITNANAQQVSIATPTATSTINDNDSLELSIAGFTITETEATQTANFTVTSTIAAEEDIVFTLTTAHITTTEATDFTTQTAQSYTLLAGDTSMNLPVAILGDLIAEPTETFTGTIAITNANAQQVTIATPTATSTINDNDSLELSIAGFTITETEATQTANFTVTSNIAAEEDIVFTLTTAHITTTEATDFTTQTAQSYTLSAGDTSMNLPVAILGDLIAEPTETFTGTIAITNANAQQVTIATPTATSTINDNDSLELSIAGFTITETEATQTANFTVTSNIAAEEDIVFTLTTAHITTTEATDFTTQTAQPYTLSAGDTTMNLPVAILGDLIAEPTETFTGTIAITNANAQQVTIATPTATSTINDNDSLELSIAGFTITETEVTQTANFTVTNNIAAEEDIVFTLTTAHITTTEATDFTTQTAQSYTLSAGDTSMNLPVAILGDLIAEPTETFTGTIAITNANAQQVTIATPTATSTINDNDSATLSINDVSVNEGDGTATFTISLTGNVQNNFTVDYSTADNTAIASSDYTAIPSTTLTFGGTNNN